MWTSTLFRILQFEVKSDCNTVCHVLFTEKVHMQPQKSQFKIVIFHNKLMLFT